MSEEGEPCPHCHGKYEDILDRWANEQAKSTLSPNPAENALSRRDNETKICDACAKAEAFADTFKFLDEEEARIVVENDRQEAMRLPEGFMNWGATGWPTGREKDRKATGYQGGDP